MSETTTIKLRKPLKVAGKDVHEVTLRTEAVLGDLEAMDKGKGDTEKTRHLIAALSVTPDGFGIPAHALKALDARDFMNLSKEVGKAFSEESEDEEGSEEPKK